MYITVCMASSIQPDAQPASPPNTRAEPKAANPIDNPDLQGRLSPLRWVMVPARAVGTMAKLLVARA